MLEHANTKTVIAVVEFPLPQATAPETRELHYHWMKLLHKLNMIAGYAFFSELDVSMQYYTFEANDEMKDSCTKITQYS